mmetsp:Transcript_48825/g.123202  ORF Transcript_48825/g.123202 Transcript_48825/m.123202 type:complete len:92 (-) Transcript_48825:164-439(-)
MEGFPLLMAAMRSIASAQQMQLYRDIRRYKIRAVERSSQACRPRVRLQWLTPAEVLRFITLGNAPHASSFAAAVDARMESVARFVTIPTRS